MKQLSQTAISISMGNSKSIKTIGLEIIMPKFRESDYNYPLIFQEVNTTIVGYKTEFVLFKNIWRIVKRIPTRIMSFFFIKEEVLKHIEEPKRYAIILESRGRVAWKEITDED